MQKTKDIRAWKAPQWHQDWGDMQRELNLLKKLALAIEKLDLPYSCTLDTEIKGYMHIQLYNAEKEIGSVHIVDPVIDRYGCFLEIEIAGFPDADEFYTTDIQDITDLLCGKNTDKIYKKIAQRYTNDTATTRRNTLWQRRLSKNVFLILALPSFLALIKYFIQF